MGEPGVGEQYMRSKVRKRQGGPFFIFKIIQLDLQTQHRSWPLLQPSGRPRSQLERRMWLLATVKRQRPKTNTRWLSSADMVSDLGWGRLPSGNEDETEKHVAVAWILSRRKDASYVAETFLQVG